MGRIYLLEILGGILGLVIIFYGAKKVIERWTREDLKDNLREQMTNSPQSSDGSSGPPPA